MEEWDLFDRNRNSLGRTSPRCRELPPGEYHIVVGVWVSNSRTEILVTLRDESKESWPGKWENSGGCAAAGETSEQAVVRELFEETGIRITEDELVYLGYNFDGSSIVDSFFIHRDVEISELVMQPGETAAAKWVTLEELDEMAVDGTLAPPIAADVEQMREKFCAELYRKG